MAETQSVLRFEKVSVQFNELKALKGVSFELKEGETRIVMGAAGSGKTVLLKAAIGLETVSDGKIVLFDQEIGGMREQDLFDLRQRVGVLFQEGALFDSMNVEKNVAYPLLTRRNQKGKPAEKVNMAETHARIQEALDFVELGKTLKLMPAELSGGMRRRAAIARAVAAKPPLLLYDSPTAGLDPITAHTIMALIIKERDVDNTTAIVVTYRYQDGNLVANFRYNPEDGQLVPDQDAAAKTIFMVLKEGSLVFEGLQEKLESSNDEYVKKFVKRD